MLKFSEGDFIELDCTLEHWDYGSNVKQTTFIGDIAEVLQIRKHRWDEHANTEYRITLYVKRLNANFTVYGIPRIRRVYKPDEAPNVLFS